MIDIFILILILGLASGLASTTIAQGKIFDTPRGWLGTKLPWLGQLIGCPFCLGHWMSLILLASYLYSIGENSPSMWYITEWFAVTAVSSITSGLIDKLN